MIHFTPLQFRHFCIAEFYRRGENKLKYVFNQNQFLILYHPVPVPPTSEILFLPPIDCGNDLLTSLCPAELTVQK